MMDEDSATSEPDVGAIDLSSHSSGRRRRAAARHGEHFNTVFLDMCPRVHRHILYFHSKHFKWAMILSHQWMREPWFEFLIVR